MNDTDKAIETTETPEGLAKRMFLFTLFGVVAYIAIVITLVSSMD